MSGNGKPDRSSDTSTVNPGDAAPAGTPGTGENVCQDCKGSGRIGNVPCKTCGGTGKVIEGMENIDQIKRGEPVINPDKMVSVKVAADIAA